MKKTTIALIIIALIIIGTIVFIIFKTPSTTGQAVVLTGYTFTKAVCDESHFCQDFEFVCENNQTKAINPVLNSERQFSKSWQDPRTQEEIDKVCK